MSFLKRFCKHEQLFRTLASFEYPVTFFNVVAFPVFIFPPPGPFAQQTGRVFSFGFACLERASPEVQHWQSQRRAVLKARGWSQGCSGDWEEMRVLVWPAALLEPEAEPGTWISSLAGQRDLRQCLCPLGCIRKQRDPFQGTLSQGCFVLWGPSVPSNWGEISPGNPRQPAWEIPGSLIYSRNTFAQQCSGEALVWYSASLPTPRPAGTARLGQAPAQPALRGHGCWGRLCPGRAVGLSQGAQTCLPARFSSAGAGSPTLPFILLLLGGC